ncbi:MAG: hypothetical protein ACFFD2_25605 [Promethearchaeota archaeon]
MDTDKRLAAVERLEKKIRRRLKQGLTHVVIPDIRFIIDQYRALQMHEKADLMEMILNQFISESRQTTDEEPDAMEENTESEEVKPKGPVSRKKKREALGFLHRD